MVDGVASRASQLLASIWTTQLSSLSSRPQEDLLAALSRLVSSHVDHLKACTHTLLARGAPPPAAAAAAAEEGGGGGGGGGALPWYAAPLPAAPLAPAAAAAAERGEGQGDEEGERLRQAAKHARRTLTFLLALVNEGRGHVSSCRCCAAAGPGHQA